MFTMHNHETEKEESMEKDELLEVASDGVGLEAVITAESTMSDVASLEYVSDIDHDRSSYDGVEKSDEADLAGARMLPLPKKISSEIADKGLILDDGREDAYLGGSSERETKMKASFQTDLSTEVSRGAQDRRHQALLRSVSSAIPQSTHDRRTRGIRKFLHRPLERKQKNEKPAVDKKEALKHGRLVVSSRNWEGGDSNNNSNRSARSYEPEIGGSQRVSDGRQYRLDSAAKNRSLWACLLNSVGCGKGGLNFYDDPSSGYEVRSSWSLNAWVIRYLFWTFRASLVAIFLSAVAAMFLFVALFAVPIYFVGKKHPTCMTGYEDAATEMIFMDCFSLSWQSFISVGFGSTSPAIYSDVDNCASTNILMAVEVFSGTIFACLCSAIIFARIGRIQSYAQVSFSHAMVVRYGTGVQNRMESDADSSDFSGGGSCERTPCPILEFRMVNRMFGAMGGEIMDASLNIVASINANQASQSVIKAANRRRGGKKGYKRQHRQSGTKKRLKHSTNKPPTLPEDKPFNSPSLSISSSIDSTGSTSIRVSSRFVEEDPTGRYVPRKIFCRLQVDPIDHPFFKRVWVVRHVLDQDSPLLKDHARQMLIRNSGFWPLELNTHEGVRAALSFEQILVSMTGVCNADANTVFAQKVYTFADAVVGYRFANLLYRDPGDGTLQVDLRLLNDITEQSGGGGEPLTSYGQEKPMDVTFL